MEGLKIAGKNKVENDRPNIYPTTSAKKADK